MEEIHSFRTEIKKLKAFLRLLNIKSPKKLNQIYKVLGYIRILQLQTQNIGKLILEADIKMPFTYLMIYAKAATYTIKAKSLIKGYHSTKKTKAAIKIIVPNKITHKAIKIFIQTELNILRPILGLKKIADESMHDIRKLLKDLQYNESYIKNDHSAKLISRLYLDEQIHSLTRLLGEFHDICVAIRQLPEKFTTYTVSRDEINHLLKLRHKWQEDKDHLSKMINQKLDGLKRYFL